MSDEEDNDARVEGEEDEEDDDNVDIDGEEDDDEDEPPTSKRHRFFDDAAAEDDDDEVESVAEGDGEPAEEEIVDSDVGEMLERRKNRRALFDKEMSEAELNTLAERYAQRPMEEVGTFTGASGIAADQHRLLPTVSDPKLYLIRCKPGMERQLVMSLMQKHFSTIETGQRMELCSAITTDNMKGYVYIEARKETHVKTAIFGLRGFLSWTVKLVPMYEMVDVFAINPKEIHLGKDSWVRCTRGVYKGDIGQVVEFEEHKNIAVIKLVPRIDYAKLEQTLNATPNEENKRKRVATRKQPPQKLFNLEELKNTDLAAHADTRRNPTTGETFVFFDGQRFKNGYVYKEISVKSLEHRNVMPTLDELQRFQSSVVDSPDDAPPTDMQQMLVVPTRVHSFVKGDSVKVIEGDLKHLVGRVTSVEGDKVTMKPLRKDIPDLLAFPASQLVKSFSEGDHVKVNKGRYADQTGLILRVDNDTVVMFSDVSKQEIRVFAQDIKKATEVSTGLDTVSNFQLHDMVNLDSASVGVIIRIEREMFRVLDNNGAVRDLRLQELGSKKNSKHSRTPDAQQNALQVGDLCRVLDGPYKDRQGSVLHIFRTFVFLFSREIMENSGVLVLRSRGLVQLGSRPGSSSYSTTPGGSLPPRSPSLHDSPAAGGPGPSARHAPWRGLGPGRGRRRDDPLLHQTVTVIGGVWKGHIGIVKGATDAIALVELHTNCKTVNVERSKLRTASSMAAPHGLHATPSWEGAATPSHGYDGSRTPRYEGAHTPRHDTPVHTRPWEAASPAYSMNTPGARTPGSPFTATDFMGDSTDLRSPLDQFNTNPSTPGLGLPYTPAGGYMDPHTPRSPADPFGGAFVPGGPVGTPGSVSTPGGPATPASPYEPAQLVMYPNIQVKLISTGAIGHITEVQPDGTCVVQPMVEAEDGTCTDEGHPIPLPPDMLELRRPSRKNQVKVMRGQYAGQVGELIGLDGQEGIVKINADIKMLAIDDLARVHNIQ